MPLDDPALGVSLDQTLNSNQGTLKVNNGRQVNLSSALQNTGTLEISGAGSQVRATSFVQSGQGRTVMQGSTLILGNDSPSFVSGGRVAGNGTVRGKIGFGTGGGFAPGFSPGRIDIEGDLTWSDGGVTEFDLGANAANSDFIAITGNLFKGGSGTFAFDFIDKGWVLGQTYDLIGFDSTNFSFSDFSYNQSDSLVGTFSVESGGTSTLQFTITAVPEPSSLALPSLVAFGAAVYGNRQRRKRLANRRGIN